MNAIAIYVRFLRRFLRIRVPLRVAVDCSNGATGSVMRALRRKAAGKLDLFLINETPDGNFPAHGPNPFQKGALRKLQRVVRGRRADLGVIFDADGDRVFFVDDKGRKLPSDHAAILVGMGSKGSVVFDMRSGGYLAREWFGARGRNIVRSRIGHFFIKTLMRAKRIPYGAEMSGHYYFKEFFFADSGVFAAIRAMNALSAMRAKGRRLSDWVDALPPYFRIPEMNFKVKDALRVVSRVASRFSRSAAKISYRDGVTMEFGKGNRAWWFNLRASQTEPVLRLNLETKQAGALRSRYAAVRRVIVRGGK